MKNIHSFHIPVMGIGFTIDSPIKVSQFGIDSAISLADDRLLEQLREGFCEKYKFPFIAINRKVKDYRAKRITSYLNLIKEITEKKFAEFKVNSFNSIRDIKSYFDLLPDGMELKEEFKRRTEKAFNLSKTKEWIKKNLHIGSIDVNIMTKVDGVSYQEKEPLPIAYNDAHSALRGFANSNLNSSIIFSAGMNPALFSYLEQFENFFPDANNQIKQKIILKVSDYRSALIQGTYLAKKGLWVSEYRIESGLNCGGHAFATDGYLMGPILEQFKTNREELHATVFAVLIDALSKKEYHKPKNLPIIKVTAQGGVGTAEEHQFLLDHYQVDSVGWGSPFLLVPEATTVDPITMDKLSKATESDLYLSDISPLGVQFNNLKGNTKDIEKEAIIQKREPGSPCIKKHLAFNTEFTTKPICTASSQYQKLKIEELKEKSLSEDKFQKKYDRIVEKACLCMGLSASAITVNDLTVKESVKGVSVCPGPNLAYFSKIVSLKAMVKHIYGSSSVISRTDRPNMFIKELTMYLDYLSNKIDESVLPLSKKEEKGLVKMAKNLKEGIIYYNELFTDFFFQNEKNHFIDTLAQNKIRLQQLNDRIIHLQL